ncbi:alpha/beta-hydrolase [Dendrothele bispora CBS 962.96]|uniref:Carboxylic ester hydrolase n=1 Tax=Dendrothele bispora (strain CBS 962.96) TaxID=1314807 RepID=A0A4S8M0H6_DENBC|nr:alpha/beta-hydrolase [Dendrothele bispora CBS 962.96]
MTAPKSQAVHLVSRSALSRPTLLLLIISLLYVRVFGTPIPSPGTSERPSSDDDDGGGSKISNTVKLDYGTFVGVSDSDMLSWKGIRYAEAPVKELRWKAPVSPPKEKLGTVQANKLPKQCVSLGQPDGDEDCLFLNVFSPADANNEGSGLPVLVWIHGGGFQQGSSEEGNPAKLMKSSKKPFVFVSIQYRLGEFGFLAGSQIQGSGKGDANAGLLDQRAALKWVQNYISKFGGDPKQVTIWGQSAGGGSTMFQLMANDGDSEGLFHAAIGDSPSMTLTPSAPGDYVNDLFDAYAGFAGCNKDDALTCLRSLPLSKLKSAASQLKSSRPDTKYLFAPVLDGSFIKERPVKAFADGRFAKVNALFGSNTEDGFGWSAKMSSKKVNTATPDANEDNLYNFFEGQYPKISRQSFDEILKLYPMSKKNDNGKSRRESESPESSSNTDAGSNLIDTSLKLNTVNDQSVQMYGELRYICTASMIAGNVSGHGSKAYQYRYDNSHLNSHHHFELQAMFPSDKSSKSPNDADKALFEKMRQYWTSFATSGIPEAEGGTKWDPIQDKDSGSPRMLLSPETQKMEMLGLPLVHRCSAWHRISEELEI